LNLNANDIDAKGAKALAAALQHPNCKLTSLHLNHNYIDAEGAKALAAALQHPNCKLTSLYLKHSFIDHSCIDAKGAKALAAALQHPDCKLTSLVLSEDYMGVVGVKALAHAVAFNLAKGKRLDSKCYSERYDFEQLVDEELQKIKQAEVKQERKCCIL
jgi:hypothetical protein